MDVTDETKVNIEKIPNGNNAAIPERLQAKYAVIGAALDAGIGQTAIAEGLKMPRSSVNHIARALDKKYDLTSQMYVKLAAKAQKLLLEGKPVGEMQTVKGSDVSAAIDRVYDRVQPKISHNVNLNLDVDIDPVDLSKFKNNPSL